MARPVKWPPSIYRHSSGQAFIRVAGRNYYLGKHDSPEAKREYARLISELTAKGEAGPARARDIGPGLTVREVLARFLTHARQHYSERGGQVSKFQVAIQVVDEVLGETPVSAFGSAELRRIQTEMAERGWCAPTVNRHIVRVRTAWRWLEEEDRTVPPGSWSALRAVSPLRSNHPLYRAAPKRQRTTDMESVRRVCRWLPDPVRAALLVQWWTGARTSEIRTMRAGDVDRSSDDVWIYRPRQHKNDWRGQERVIVLGPKAIAVLRPWLASCGSPDDFVFPPAPSRFRLSDGRRTAFSMTEYDRSRCYTLYSYCQAVRRAADRAGLPGFHGYLCRGAARMRISRHMGDEAARAMLGQRTIDVALRYGTLDADLAREAARKLG